MKSKNYWGAFMALPLTLRIGIITLIGLIFAAVSFIWGIKALMYIMIAAMLIPFAIKTLFDDHEKEKREKASGEISQSFEFLSHWIFEILQCHSATLGIVRPDSLEDIFITHKRSIQIDNDRALFNYMAYKLPSSCVTEQRIKEILELELLRKHKIANSSEKNSKIRNYRLEKVTFFESYIIFSIRYVM